MPDVNAQQVIVYDTEREQEKVYDSAYDPKQVTRGIKQCAEYHGTTANVRAMLAEDRAPTWRAE
jgi:hypothetical protein